MNEEVNFCSQCGATVSPYQNFCSYCGYDLEKSSTKTSLDPNIKLETTNAKLVGSEVEINEIKKDSSFNLWSPLRGLLQFTTTIIFIASFFTFINFMSGSHGTLDMLLFTFSTSVGLTVIPWIIVLLLTKPFRKNINQGAFLFSGFLGMVSLWIGYWWGYSLHLEVPGISKDVVEVFWMAIMLSPIWFLIGLLGKFKKKPNPDD